MKTAKISRSQVIQKESYGRVNFFPDFLPYNGISKGPNYQKSVLEPRPTAPPSRKISKYLVLVNQKIVTNTYIVYHTSDIRFLPTLWKKGTNK